MIKRGPFYGAGDFLGTGQMLDFFKKGLKHFCPKQYWTSICKVGSQWLPKVGNDTIESQRIQFTCNKQIQLLSMTSFNTYDNALRVFKAVGIKGWLGGRERLLRVESA